jgi:hypothetical protein
MTLSAQLEVVAQKFDLLDAKKAVPFLKEFLENVERVQVCLGEFEERLVRITLCFASLCLFTFPPLFSITPSVLIQLI